MSDEKGRYEPHDGQCEASWADGHCLCDRRMARKATAPDPERGQRAFDRLSTVEIRFLAERYIEAHVGGLLIRDTVPALCDGLEAARNRVNRVLDAAAEVERGCRHVAPGSYDDGFVHGMRRAAKILGGNR